HPPLDEKIVRPCQRLDPTAEALDEIRRRRRAAQRLIGDGLNDGQSVLHAVIQFVEKKSLQFLIPLPRRDIARHLGGTDHIASAIPDGRHRERNVDPATFLGESDSIEMIDPFTAAQSRENVVLFPVKLYGNDAVDGLADHLLRLIAEDSRRTRVPGRYAPVERLADDGVCRGSDYRGEASGFDISRLAIGALDQEIGR